MKTVFKAWWQDKDGEGRATCIGTFETRELAELAAKGTISEFESEPHYEAGSVTTWVEDHQEIEASDAYSLEQ